MTARERLERAIGGRHPDRPPVVLPYFHLYLDEVVGEMTAGDLSWAHRMYGSPEEKAAIYRMAVDRFGLDWLPIGGVGTAVKTRHNVLETVDGILHVGDTRTGETFPAPAVKPAEPPVTERLVNSADPAELAKLPPVMTPDGILATGALEPARILAREFGADVPLVSGASLPGNLNYFHLGVYDMMTALRLEPDLVHALVEHSTASIMNLLEAQASVGIHTVWLEDCFVAGDLIAREDYETFFFRANAAIIEKVRDLGMYSIYYLTGDVMPRIPHILDMSPDCLAFEESRKTFIVDPVEIRKAVGGRMCLLGNVDVYADIERGDERAWRRCLRHQLSSAVDGGRFIVSAGSPVTPDTPPEKLERFVAFAKGMGTGRAVV